jgi:hypothetical protein
MHVTSHQSGLDQGPPEATPTSRAVQTWSDLPSLSAASMMEHLAHLGVDSPDELHVEGPIVGSVVASVVNTRSGVLAASGREAWIETDRVDDRHDGWTSDRTGPDGRWVVVDTRAGRLFSAVGQRVGRNSQALPPESVTGVPVAELDVVSWAKVDRTTWVVHDGDGMVLVEVQADSSRTMGTQESSNRLLAIGPIDSADENLTVFSSLARALTEWLGKPDAQSDRVVEVETEVLEIEVLEIEVSEREAPDVGEQIQDLLRQERAAVADADARWAMRWLRRWAKRNAGEPWPVGRVDEAQPPDPDEIRLRALELMDVTGSVETLQELLVAWRSNSRSRSRQLAGKRAARLRMALAAVTNSAGVRNEIRNVTQRVDRRLSWCRRREALVKAIDEAAASDLTLEPETWMALGVERQRVQRKLNNKYARLQGEIRQLIELLERR